MNDIQDEVRALAGKRNALILAHYYQAMEIQEVADAVGDSFELAKRASAAVEEVVMLCGVRFMAESAKILSPMKTVLLPTPGAGCPMADMVAREDVLRLRREHPAAAVVCYVNTSAEVKAASDICCTSSSAVRVVKSLPHKQVVFIPDKNLGAYVAAQTPEKEFFLYDGSCPIHQKVSEHDVLAARMAHPGAKFLAHPECPPAVAAMADGVGSTAYILKTVEGAPDGEGFIIGTEAGVAERLRITAPGKKTWTLRSGFICQDMKKTTLIDVKRALISLEEIIELQEETAEAARVSLARMIEVA